MRKRRYFPSINNQRIKKHGLKVDVLDIKTANKIRERLNLSRQQLSDDVIAKITTLANEQIGQWIVDNPDGYMLHKDMGALSVSKFLPRQFRVDKEETVDRIKELDISEYKRKRILASYDVDIGDRLTTKTLNGVKTSLPFFNIETLFYTYKILWFNHRNCTSHKAPFYRFKATRKITSEANKKAITGKSYYEWQFSDWFKKKVKK